MNANLDNIAEELFGKIRTRFPKIEMGDKSGAVIENEEDLKNARFFEFDYVKEGVSLGSVSIKLSEKKGLTVMYSNDIAEGQPQPVINEWYAFLKSLREFARRRLLNYETRDLVKSNLDKRDYNFLATNSGEGQMTESKLWGTNRTSFQDMGDAKIIVKHSQNVNYDNPAGRTLHIESIFIENAQGERFKYPYKHLNGARALAQHVAHGGTPYDAIGEHVIGLSEELSKLRFFKGYVSRQEQISEAMGTVTGKVIERIDQVKKEIHQLQNASHYKSFAESFSQSEAEQIPEDIVNDWVDKLTIRNFNEALKDVFPYIYKLVGEGSNVKELTPDDLLGEDSEEKCDDCHKPVDDCECDDHDHDDEKDIKEFAEFEYTLESLLSEDDGIASSDEAVKSAALEKLNQFLSTNPTAGVDGTNATMSLKDIITDPKFMKVLGDLPSETELAPIIKGYLETEHPELVDQVTFPSAGQEAGAPTPAPEAPAPTAGQLPAAPAAEPAPTAEQPVAAESQDDAPFDGGRPVGDKKDKFGNVVKKRAQHSAKQGLVAAIEKARKAGMKSEDTIEIGGQKMSLSELAERAGITLKPHPKEIVEFIKSFYDKEHGTFPKGETGVLIATEKKFGEEATPIAHRVIETLSQISETHRMRKLAGMRPDNMAFESVTYESIMLSEAPDAGVMKLQQELIAKGAKIKADGIMGPATQAAAAQFGISPAAQAIGVTPAKGNAPVGTPNQRPTMARDPRLLTNIDGGAGAIAGAQAGKVKTKPAGAAAQPTPAAAPAAAPETPISGSGTPMNAADLAKAQGKEPAADPNAPEQSTTADAPPVGSQAPTAQADVEKAKVGIAAGSPALQPQQTAAAPAAAPASSGYRGNFSTVASNAQPGDTAGSGSPMAGAKPAAPAGGQAAQPAAPAAPAPLSTVQPTVKSGSGGAVTSGDGTPIKSRSELELAWSQLNPRQPYPGDAAAQAAVSRRDAAGQKNLDAVKGVWNKLTGKPASESVTFANDELSRLISLVRHK